MKNRLKTGKRNPEDMSFYNPEDGILRTQNVLNEDITTTQPPASKVDFDNGKCLEVEE